MEGNWKRLIIFFILDSTPETSAGTFFNKQFLSGNQVLYPGPWRAATNVDVNAFSKGHTHRVQFEPLTPLITSRKHEPIHLSAPTHFVNTSS